VQRGGRDGRFAAGSHKDYEAVRVALTHEWSNRQTEGQINRLKFLKYQVYGRPNVNLLKACVLHAARLNQSADGATKTATLIHRVWVRARFRGRVTTAETPSTQPHPARGRRCRV
jgi:hypothetical protein